MFKTCKETLKYVLVNTCKEKMRSFRGVVGKHIVPVKSNSSGAVLAITRHHEVGFRRNYSRWKLFPRRFPRRYGCD